MTRIEAIKAEWKTLLKTMKSIDETSEEYDELNDLTNELENELFELDEFETTDSVIEFLNS